MDTSIHNEVMDLKEELIQIRRDFHQHPELGFEEARTSGVISDYLHDLGLNVKTGIAQTGVAGLLPANSSGKTLLIRADMDALPIQEENDAPYRSRKQGVMHACGHDGHMAIALIAAKVLSRHEKEIHGQVKFVFQPGEEGFGGAREMINEGVLKEPRVDAAIGLHLTHFIPTGTIAIRSGPVMASMDSVTIKVLGQAGHAAMPHEGVDAVLVSSHVVSALQSLISKEVSPMTPLIVHIGTIHGGDAFNIIADKVELNGTVRCLDEQLQKSMPDRMERIIKGIVTGLRGNYDLKYQFGYPPLINDKGMVDLIRGVAKDVVGNGQVVKPQPIMASDDMAFFLRQVPGCYLFLGAGNPEKGFDQPAHNPHFDFDEDAMITGSEIMVNAALRYLRQH